MRYNEIIEKLDGMKPRSAWNKGVLEYSYELLDNVFNSLMETDFNPFEKEIDRDVIHLNCFNGAYSPIQYSYGGCALIYDRDIAIRLCNTSELRRTDFGRLHLNKNENWLDVQARALVQAEKLLIGITEEA